MIGFIIGVFVGAGVGLAIAAFMVAVSDEGPDKDKDIQHKEPWRWEGWK